MTAPFELGPIMIRPHNVEDLDGIVKWDDETKMSGLVCGIRVIVQPMLTEGVLAQIEATLEQWLK